MPRIKPNAIDRPIGERIRQRRADYHISMRQLGRAIGVSWQQVQKYENAKSQVSASRLCEIARELQVPIEYFFAESGKKRQQFARARMGRLCAVSAKKCRTALEK